MASGQAVSSRELRQSILLTADCGRRQIVRSSIARWWCARTNVAMPYRRKNTLCHYVAHLLQARRIRGRKRSIGWSHINAQSLQWRRTDIFWQVIYGNLIHSGYAPQSGSINGLPTAIRAALDTFEKLHIQCSSKIHGHAMPLVSNIWRRME